MILVKERTILASSVSLLLLSSCGANKSIRSVAEIRVDAPEGTAPVLPYQIWVTYADRSGNLAEPEDLDALLRLVVETKEIPNKSTRLREAIDFADMVIQYVNDGSGTKDLIDRARNNLQEALKSL